MTISDFDNLVQMLTGTSAFSSLLPRATMEFIPRPICPAVLLAQAVHSSKDSRERERERERETDWDWERVSEWWKEKTERDRGRWWTEWDRDLVKEGKNWKTPIRTVLFCFFCDGNPVLSNHRHHRKYHLAPATAPYLDNAWQKVPWNMNSLHDESHRWDSSL